MISGVEQGVANFLTVFFAAQEVTCAVHTGVSNAPIPSTEPVVIVTLRECLHEVGPLYTGKLEVTVSTPAIAQKTPQDHRLLMTEVEDAFDADNADELSQAVQAQANCTVNGWFWETEREAVQDERWHTTASITLGLVRLD